VCVRIGLGAGEPSWTCLTYSVGSYYILIQITGRISSVKSNKYNINAVVLGRSKRIESFAAVCVRMHAQSQCTCVLCDVTARDLGVFLAIGGHSCLATNCKACVPVNGKLEKHF